MSERVVDYLWVQPSTVFDIVVLVLYICPVTMLNAYGLSKAVNVFRAIIATAFFTSKPTKGGTIQPGEEPMVTIQICSYNEGNVIEDTINAACTVDWPKDKLCVQVLDDSTDETVMIIEALCQKWREQGLECLRLSRLDRVGYKAGILHHHTPSIKGDFVGMFDADHRCENQFLRRCVPQFYDDEGNSLDNIGCVQCPWAYYNVHDNILTEYDGLNLDTAFVIEQTARSAYNQSFSFNGTGGIWRKAAIQAGGGWSWDTITEDLDLSYESYMAGYRFVFLRDLPQQLELPAGIRAHIQQKFRWTKGFWQVTRKTLLRILMSKDTPVRMKLEVLFQYTGALAYTLTLLATVIAPIISYRGLFSPLLLAYTIFPVFTPLVGGTCTIFGKVSGSGGMYKSFWSRLLRLRFLPVLMVLAMGMMVFETYSIYSGLASDDATFVRTPKKGTPLDGEKKLDYEDDDDECVNDGDQRPANGTDDSERLSDSYLSDDDAEGAINEAGTQERRGTNCHFRCPSCPSPYSRLSPKGQKFVTNATNGMLGLLIGAYFLAWVSFLISKKIKDNTPIDITAYEDLMLFLLPMPSIGLFFVHGTFMYHLLSYKVRKWREKRLAAIGKKPQERVDMRPFWYFRRASSSHDTVMDMSSHSFDLASFSDVNSFASSDDIEEGFQAEVEDGLALAKTKHIQNFAPNSRTDDDERSLMVAELEFGEEDPPQNVPVNPQLMFSLTMADESYTFERKTEKLAQIRSLASFGSHDSLGSQEDNAKEAATKIQDMVRSGVSRERVVELVDRWIDEIRIESGVPSRSSSFRSSTTDKVQPSDGSEISTRNVTPARIFASRDEAATLIQSIMRATLVRIRVRKLIESMIIGLLKDDPVLQSTGIVDLEELPLHPVRSTLERNGAGFNMMETVREEDVLASQEIEIVFEEAEYGAEDSERDTSFSLLEALHSEAGSVGKVMDATGIHEASQPNPWGEDDPIRMNASATRRTTHTARSKDRHRHWRKRTQVASSVKTKFRKPKVGTIRPRRKKPPRHPKKTRTKKKTKTGPKTKQSRSKTKAKGERKQVKNTKETKSRRSQTKRPEEKPVLSKERAASGGNSDWRRRYWRPTRAPRIPRQISFEQPITEPEKRIERRRGSITSETAVTSISTPTSSSQEERGAFRRRAQPPRKAMANGYKKLELPRRI